MSNPNPPAAASTASHWLTRMGWLALVAYALFIALTAKTVAGGSDSSGYLNSARIFAAGQFLVDMRVPAEFGAPGQIERSHFHPLGFTAYAAEPRYAPTYPTGLPLLLALAGSLLGWDAGPLAIAVLAALGAVWLCYASARELGLGPPLALAGATILATFPVFLFTSLQPLSDTLATTVTLAAWYAALRSRPHRTWALAAGAAFAFAVLVRPTNLLFAPALLVLLGGDMRRLALFTVGGIPGAAWLAFYNHSLYGSVFRSGYGDIFSAFALSYGAPTALHFAKWLALLLPAVVLALPFAALARSDRRRELLALALAFGAITGLYAFYEISHEVWWCLRFILPAVPALLLAALLGVDHLTRHSPRLRAVAAAALAVWAIANGWAWTRHLNVFLVPRYEQAYADAAVAARTPLPKDALVAACAFSGALYYYNENAVLRYDQIEAPAFARYAALARAAGRPIFALIFDWEEAEALRKHCPGDWIRLSTVANVGLWQLRDARPTAAK